jgi:hypothetical protein
LLNRAAASVVQEKPEEEEISSGASTPQKSGASSGKVRLSGFRSRARADLWVAEHSGKQQEEGKEKVVSTGDVVPNNRWIHIMATVPCHMYRRAMFFAMGLTIHGMGFDHA